MNLEKILYTSTNYIFTIIFVSNLNYYRCNAIIMYSSKQQKGQVVNVPLRFRHKLGL